MVRAQQGEKERDPEFMQLEPAFEAGAIVTGQSWETTGDADSEGAHWELWGVALLPGGLLVGFP